MFASRSKIQSGFTLIELIIVIVIVGIMASLATITVGDHKQELLQTEAKRFQALFVLARQEAVLQSLHLGMRFSKNGYQFYQMLDANQASELPSKNPNAVDDTVNNAVDIEAERQTKWQLLQDPILKSRYLPNVLSSQLYLDGISIELLTTNVSGEKPATDIKASQQIKPQIFLLSSGENTAFEYQLDYSGVGRVMIKVDPVGQLELKYFYDKQTE